MKKKIMKVFLLMTLFLALPNGIKAVTFSVTKSADNIKPNGEFILTVKAAFGDNEKLTGYDLYTDFDVNKVEFVEDAGSETSELSITGGTIHIKNKQAIDKTTDFDVANIKMRVKGTASADSSNLALRGSCEVDASEANSCKYQSSTITVAPLGSEASLASLSLGENIQLSPEFSSGTTTYKATVQDITKINVDAKANSGGTVQISDNWDKLQKGENKIDIVVTSEDGNNKKTYTINVTANFTPTPEEQAKANAKLKTLVIKDLDKKLDLKADKDQTFKFDPDEPKYYLIVKNDVTKLDITATPENEKAKVSIENNSKLTVGKKNIIKITVTSEDGTKTQVYTIQVTRSEEEKEVVKTCPDMNDISNWTKYVWIIFSISAFVTFTLGIVLGYFLCKKDVLHKIFKKKNKDKKEPLVGENKNADDDFSSIETLSDTIDLTDTFEQLKDKQ